MIAGAMVRNAAGALPIGQRNAAFYRRYGKAPQFFAPYSVDNERFRVTSDRARPSRAERLTSLGLDPDRPTVIFSGKLIAKKRPLDIVRAVERSGAAFNLLLLGDGPLRAEVRRHEEAPASALPWLHQPGRVAWLVRLR